METSQVVKLASRPGVYFSLDQCAFGLRVGKGPMEGELAKKPAALLTDVPELAEFVEKRRQSDHLPGPLFGGTAAQAAIYPPDFVKALVAGIRQALGTKPSKIPKWEKGFISGKAMGQVLLVVEAEAATVFFSPMFSHFQWSRRP